MKSKFLVLNPDPANIDTIVAKANVQNTKNGPFDAVLLLGDAITSLPTTAIDAPTYFGRGSQDVEVAGGGDSMKDVGTNLTYVPAPFTVFKLASGLKIAYVSESAADATFDAKLAEAGPVDVLVTYGWPWAIAKEQKLSLVGNKVVDTVVKALRPRYHFAVGHERGKFHERPPFAWEDGRITRFISLGREGSGDKWFYAYMMGKDESATASAANPFTAAPPEVVTEKRPVESLEPLSSQPIKRAKVVGPELCFFCLSNPKVETHMIVSIGKHAYLTVAKGPLPRALKHRPFSGHAIIVPVEHKPTLRSDAKVADSPVYQEMLRYKANLEAAFAAKYPELQLVFFEIDREENVHHHVQVMPIPKDDVAKFEKALEDKAKINNDKFTKNAPLAFRRFDGPSDELEDLRNAADHIAFTVGTTTFISTIAKDTVPDLQFPRRVLAYTLKCPKRIYWDRCQQPKFEEAKECDDFKEFFAPYDKPVEG